MMLNGFGGGGKKLLISSSKTVGKYIILVLLGSYLLKFFSTLPERQISAIRDNSLWPGATLDPARFFLDSTFQLPGFSPVFFTI